MSKTKMIVQQLHHRKCRPRRPVDSQFIFDFNTNILLVAFILILSVGKFVDANANKNFCGSTWGDASENCNDRQHCPGASDDECMTPGHICFADTMCDVTKGHGNGVVSSGGGGLANAFAGIDFLPPYDDRSNTRFCQSMWTMGVSCTVELWCGDGRMCPEEDQICHYSDCHLHDIMNKIKEQESKGQLSPKKQSLANSDPNDPIRNNFCGSNWEDASAKCGQWCFGEETECPPGQGCFAETTCYSDAGLVPSPYPTTYSPTTRTPTMRLDGTNFRFCGTSWETAECSLKKHCPTGMECTDGEVCFTKQRCNVHDLTKEPTESPSMSPTLSFDNPSYFKFCGKSFEHAVNNCSSKTSCSSNDDCPNGASCFAQLPGHCNAFYFLNPEKRPTQKPTPAPTLPQPTGSPTFSKVPSPSPTTSAPVTRAPAVRGDPMNMRFCGKAWDKITCSIESHCPAGTECKNGEICFTKWQCNVQDLTMTPTGTPSFSPILPRDHTAYFKFCGKTSTDAVMNCSLETHCGLDQSCPSGNSCFETPPGRCNAFDLLYPELRPTMKPTFVPTPPLPPTAPSLSPTTYAPTSKAPTKRDDLNNMRFCGPSWDNVNCSIESHCPSGLCQNGEICFMEPTCNLMDLIAPTASPSSPPVLTDNTSPPPVLPYDLPRDHPSFHKFCGATITYAIIGCRLETLCASDNDCTAGARCFNELPPHCNAFDMLYPTLTTPVPTPPSLIQSGGMNPTPLPTPRPIALRTRRPTPSPRSTPLPTPQLQIINRTLRPTRKPSAADDNPPIPMPKQTIQPTTEPISASAVADPPLYCGQTRSDANRNCGAHSFWCVGFTCPFDWQCFLVEDHLCGSNTADEYPISKTTRPTSFSTKTTQRPTNIPTKVIASVPAASLPAPATEEPTPKPVTDSPTNQKQLTPKPVTQPEPKPVTERPTKLPTQERVTMEPTPKPVSSAGGLIASILTTKTISPTARPITTLSPSKQNVILTPYPTPSPSKNVPAGIPDTEPAFQTNKQPSNGGKDTKPKESAMEDEPSVVEELETTVAIRPKNYCFTNMKQVDQQVDRDCPYAMECSEGNPCTLGKFCIEHDCKNRPPSNGALDLCPFRYVGKHTKDCKSYYDCDYYGYVGPTFSCEGGYKFDRSSGRCIQEYLVNSQCYQPVSYSLPSKTPTTMNSNNAVDVTLPSVVQIDSSDDSDEGASSTTLSPSEDPTKTPTDTPPTHMPNVTSPPTSSSIRSDAPTKSDTSWPDNNADHDLSQWFTLQNSDGKVSCRLMNPRIRLFFLIALAIWL